MPGAWPGATNSLTVDVSLKDSTLSSTKVISPLDPSAKNITTSQPGKSGSSSSRASLVKLSHSNEKCNESVGINNNTSSKHNNDLNPSGVGMVNGNIVSRGSITSVGAVLAAATLAASAASTEVATQLISPNASLRRQNSKQKQNQSSTKGKYRIIIIISK